MPWREQSVRMLADNMSVLLAPLGPVVPMPLLGTCGLYLEDSVFGLVSDGIVYFRTCPRTLPKYEQSGARQFVYLLDDGTELAMDFHAVPGYVLESADIACAWAYESASI